MRKVKITVAKSTKVQDHQTYQTKNKKKNSTQFLIKEKKENCRK